MKKNFLAIPLKEIASEKAGILKNTECPVVLAEQHPEAR